MNVAIMQPFYLFLRKHFHLLKRADIYVFMDDTQFVKNSHHNRNRIKSSQGYTWLTVPVLHRFGQLIFEVELDNKKNWRKKHWESIKQAYSKAPYFSQYKNFFEEVYSKEWDKLSSLNIFLIKEISKFLNICNTKFINLSELNILNDNPTQRLIDICENLGATNYIIGTKAKDYMEEWRWEKTNVNLEYYEPEYKPYPQLHGNFLDNCAIIDLLFNCGPESGKYIWGNDN
jgi:hypothetical protein